MEADSPRRFLYVPMSTRNADDSPYWSVFGAAFRKWQADRAPRLGAALAYYSVFSIAPLLVVVIAVAAAFFGREAAEGRVIAEMEGLLGSDGAKLVQEMIRNASEHKSSGIAATLESVAALLFGALGVFSQLQDALDTIWKARRLPETESFSRSANAGSRLCSFSG